MPDVASHAASDPVRGLDGPGRRSRWIDLDGPVHYFDFGGPPDAPSLVAVHGLGGSAANWAAIAPFLTERNRLVAVDLVGFGLTEAAGRRTTVPANRAVLHRFVDEVVGAPAVLVGNSMGGMISLLEAAEAPSSVAGLVLVNAALPLVIAKPDPLVMTMFAAYAAPGLGSAVMRARRRALSPELAVAQVLRLCCADSTRVTPDIVALHVEMTRAHAADPDLDTSFLDAARSLLVVEARRGSYLRRLKALGMPVLMIHGERDRLIPIAAARAAARANRTWTLAVLPDVGHVPMLEAPEQTAWVIQDWLDNEGRDAAAAATAVPELTAG